MKSHLPYPGYHESFSSWDYRCRQWEANRRRSQSRGLSGRPDKRCVEGGRDGTEEAWVKIAGRPQLVRVPMLDRVDGRPVRVYKRSFGGRETARAKAFADKNGMEFLFSDNGCQGMCYRRDGMAFKFTD